MRSCNGLFKNGFRGPFASALFGSPILSDLFGGFVIGTPRADDVSVGFPVKVALLRGGDDSFVSSERVGFLRAGRGDDTVTVSGGGGVVDLGRGDDVLELSGVVRFVNGGAGTDTLALNSEMGDFDVTVDRGAVILISRFTREATKVKNVEEFAFQDKTLSVEEIIAEFSDPNAPVIQVTGGTQVVTVNDTDPSVSVQWDRGVQQAVIDTDTPVGPTIASRAYAMLHTAIYDA